MARPNILFIMTDEQKWDTFSYVNPVMKTPNLDSLIKESIFFKNAYCSNPSCIPSRAAIATGKYPTACQCPTFITTMPEHEKTFMTKLQEAGYDTALVGKQHFAHSLIYHGYDYEAIVDGHTSERAYEEIRPYADFLKEQGVDEQKWSDRSLIIGGKWLGDVKYHIDSFTGQEGKRWLEEHVTAPQAQEKPWFFTLSFPGPHQPYDGEGTPYADSYALEDMERPESTAADLEGKPPHYKKMTSKAWIDNYPDEIFRRTKRSYYANVSLIDEQVGEVLQLLKDKGVYDDTMIIFSTDHGDFMGDFGLISKAQYLSEGLMHIPLFVKPPVKGFQGIEVEDYVTNVDIASTCLSVAGAGNKITSDMENHPYSDYWLKEHVVPRDYVYMEAHQLKCVIEDGIKVIYYVGREYGELYDLNHDPSERINLWQEQKYESAKSKAMGRIIDELFRFSPKSSVKWNVNAPEI